MSCVDHATNNLMNLKFFGIQKKLIKQKIL